MKDVEYKYCKPSQVKQFAVKKTPNECTPYSYVKGEYDDGGNKGGKKGDNKGGRKGFVRYLPLLIKIAVIVLALLGIADTTLMSSGYMSGTSFLYYTVQSNLACVAVCAWFLIYEVQILFERRVYIPQYAYKVKYSVTAAITLTFLVFSVLLTPQMIANGMVSYLASLSNLTLHNSVPLLMIADFVLFDFHFEQNKKSLALATIMPLYYIIFAFTLSFCGVMFAPNQNVPYFFFDYTANGWLTMSGGKIGVVYWFLLLVGFVLLEGWLLLLVAKKRSAAQRKKQALLQSEQTPTGTQAEDDQTTTSKEDSAEK